MDERYFVRIEVPTFTDHGEDGLGRHGMTGTGYPVGQDLILTARHVVIPENRDSSYPIRVRWVYFPAFERDGSVDLDPDDGTAICFVGRNDDDIALLRCPERPDGVTVPSWPWMRMPSHGASYRSIGYPAALRLTDSGMPDPKQNAFDGTIRRVADPWFEITDSSAPKTPADWQGASGMPIFVGGHIAGVFSAALSDVTGKGHAVPIAPLLDQPAFAAFFADHEGSERRKNRERKVVDDIAAILGSDTARLLKKAVIEQLSIQEQDPKEIARRLLLTAAAGDGGETSDPFASFAQRMASIYDALLPVRADRCRASQDQLDALDSLLAIVLTIAPLCYQRDRAELLYASTKGADLIELPAALYSVAELMLAAAENRCASYQARKDPNDGDARGLACLAIDAPELGISATEEDYCDRILVHLGRKGFTTEKFEADKFLEGCDRFLSHFYPKGRPLRGDGKFRETDRRRGINGAISRFIAKTGDVLNLYTVFRPENAEEDAEMRAVAEILHQRYGNLRIVFLTAFCEASPEDNPWDEEAKRVSKFVQLLPARTLLKENP